MNDITVLKRWIGGDESAQEMLARVPRPFSLLPPLHRVPFRVGNVVELVGPSSSAKTHILIQTAIGCILPKNWNGVEYGGLDQLVVFVDLDCRFDIMRMSEMLIHRIIEAGGTANQDYDENLYKLCMSRFLYIRCSNTFEFLQTLKTLHYRLEKEKEAHGFCNGLNLLMIDSIGAFHWVDRASTFLPLKGNERKKLFLQTVSEAVVRETKKLMQFHRMLIIATKSTIFGDSYPTPSNVLKRNLTKDDGQDERDSRNVTRNHQNFPYHEYMPSVWQSFVTHRLYARSSDNHLVTSNHQNCPLYLLEWLMPRLNIQEKFVVKEAGIFVV
ncbi:hypothetical protein L6164_001068 [Bauhinia variegata]|uniref:Uncharacterized protein n=1 Tax=Bauhinia variegata TaxID=167791 RepID=A0ACB9Q9S9_BAUVA|nr:hypothetical protein L6164_001068 [Bauhinia variegata]